jgi:hypothetical protein
MDQQVQAQGMSNLGLIPDYNAISELNNEVILSKEKDIEIERLKTTCFDLNNKAAVAGDLRSDMDIISRRLNESEDEKIRQEE